METFVDNWLESWSGGDPRRLLEFYDDNDLHYSDPFKTKPIKSKDELKIYLTSLLKRNPNWKWKREEIHLIKGGCVLIWNAIIPQKENKEVKVRGMDIVLINSRNRIIRNEVFYDMSVFVSKTPKF